ncbi:dickkopf-related protein 2-like [Tropilaelaps mercedesae]|uniref:Dickkopf-related protein 2-like n=1 Tax=Tropilaelaps mercedesae TaxID=418985 RepID=A0A1V9XRC0_9ACAR|nr:dickkopf-related protein 2-like [Tropilaelaps mercedesae]
MNITIYAVLLSSLIELSVSSPLWSRILHQSSEETRQLIDKGYLVACRSDDDCEVGLFCDAHYGFCDKHRAEGEACRQDGHCKDRLLCMFGECQHPPKLGRPGARCNHLSDCGPGLCCARTNGEKVCKPRLPLGEKCYVPQGGLDYILNEVCPCEPGLVCSVVEIKREMKLGSVNYDHLRCSTPKTQLSSSR